MISGMKVLNDPNFRGQLKDIDEDFKKHLKDFIPHILSPSNILVKKISGNEVKCGDLYDYFKEYVKIFQVKSRRGERERERERDIDRERERERERDIDRERERDRDRERVTERQREGEETERQRMSDRGSDRETERERQRESDRKTERERRDRE